MSQALRGKVAVVTGGGTGIGLAIAAGFAAAGAHVAICGRRAGKLASATLRVLKAAPEGDFFSTTADVSDAHSIDQLVAAVLDRYSRIDVLVNNAAVLRGGALDELSPEDIATMLTVNLQGPLLMTRAVLPVMKRQDYGRIVNITSGLGWKRLPGYIPYSASKAGLNALTRNLAAELSGWNILINAIDPGIAKTELNPRGGDEPDKAVPGVLRLATLPMGGPTGHVFARNGETLIE